VGSDPNFSVHARVNELVPVYSHREVLAIL
jgi:hypothetical protein